jgi:hypothetical protein
VESVVPRKTIADYSLSKNNETHPIDKECFDKIDDGFWAPSARTIVFSNILPVQFYLGTWTTFISRSLFQIVTAVFDKTIKRVCNFISWVSVIRKS